MSANGTTLSKTRLAKLFGVLSFLLFANTAIADVCDRVPLCQKQTKGKIHFKALQTRGWAFYCTGDYPFYWNNAGQGGLGLGNNFDRSPSCFAAAESPFGESGSHPSKADLSITNYCHKSTFPWTPESEDVTISIGCSKINQNGPACTGSYSGPQKDPGCPILNKPTQYCSSGAVPVCIQTWTELCSDKKEYYCTKDSVAPTYCVTCN